VRGVTENLWLIAFGVFLQWFATSALVRRAFNSAHILAHDAYAAGDLERALGINLNQERGPGLAMLAWNTRVCVLIAAGRYRAALRASPYPFRRAEAFEANSHEYALLVINQAEALYNIGRWRRAERLMLAIIDTGILASSGMALGGGANQLAWIFASTGRADVAQWILEGIDPALLSPDYRAEAYFTRAWAALQDGQLEKAQKHLTEGKGWSVRASSARNELFLWARLRAAQGQINEALAMCQSAADHKFRGQGGDGLLFWGDLLRDAGRTDDARSAWILAIERDPESQGAQTARKRLVSSGDGAAPTVSGLSVGADVS
jgi:tetratricopeptide (TPR) repeat protein